MASHTPEGEQGAMADWDPQQHRIMVVTRTPLDPGSRIHQGLTGYLTEAGIDLQEVCFTAALRCFSWGHEPTRSDYRVCMEHTHEELERHNPQWILALGAEAWLATSGWADVSKHRGKLYNSPYGDGAIFPTISPSATFRNPGLTTGFKADLAYFSRLVGGTQTAPPHHLPKVTHNILNKQDLRDFLRDLSTAVYSSYDIETVGRAEYDTDAAIVSISVTLATTGMDDARVWQLPLFHPQSPFKNSWREILRAIGRWLGRVPNQIAHNAKYDTKWLRHFGVPITPTFDTIVGFSLLNENEPKALKVRAQQILGADPWGVDTSKLLEMPLDDVLQYNGLDTWHTLRLYFWMIDQLHKQQGLSKLFKHLMVPLVVELVDIERRGVWVDPDRLAENWAQCKSELEGIEDKLMAFVPSREVWPPKIKEVNFNASNFARWWLFDHLGLPILARGKDKPDGSPGDPSMAEDLLAKLADEGSEVAELLVSRVKWNKFDSGFFKPWTEQLKVDSRLHTTFKPWGTVTGRLSSGREDDEKVTKTRAKALGVNLQQVPRGDLTRGCFGAPPGSFFIEADYSQVELRIAAFIAREMHMLQLYDTGQDIHLATAVLMTGKTSDEVTGDERKKAKAVNFGYLYGMGVLKFIETAWSNYGLKITEDESRAFRKAFFLNFPDLLPWHARQRRLARKFGRVQSPLGRVRHLPDIYSPDKGVRAEAERQAINSPVQGMASDMAALSLVILSRLFKERGFQGHPVGTVHDAINFEIPRDELEEALPLIKHHMENPPLEELFGVVLDVPIISDLKVGTHWGSARKIPAEALTDSNTIGTWLSSNLVDIRG